VLSVPCAWKGVEPRSLALTGLEVPR